MKRILVLGRTGAGKTTFSNKLEKVLGCKVVHLDNLFWKPGWVRAFTADEWEDEVRRLTQKDKWILDGNYHNTLDIRLERADTVVFFDTNPIQSLFRALKRAYFPSKSPNDRMLKLHQKVNILMLIRTTFSFPSKEIYRKLKYSGIKDVYVIKSLKWADEVLQTIAADCYEKESK